MDTFLVGFQVLRAVVLNVAIFWDGSQPPITRWILARLIFDPKCRNDMFLGNVGSHTDYLALNP
jgi:hypothetical protein